MTLEQLYCVELIEKDDENFKYYHLLKKELLPSPEAEELEGDLDLLLENLNREYDEDCFRLIDEALDRGVKTEYLEEIFGEDRVNSIL